MELTPVGQNLHIYADLMTSRLIMQSTIQSQVVKDAGRGDRMTIIVIRGIRLIAGYHLPVKLDAGGGEVPIGTPLSQRLGSRRLLHLRVRIFQLMLTH